MADTIRGVVPYGILIVVGRLALLAPQSQKAPEAQSWIAFAGTALTAVTLLAPVFLIAIRKRRANWKDIGFRRTEWRTSAKLICLVVALQLAATYCILRIVKHAPRYAFNFGSGWRGWILTILIAGVFAGFTEEIFFRGFLFAGLRQRFTFWITATISAIVFGIGHELIWPQTIDGMLVAWLKERTGSLWPCVVAHAAFNTILLFVTHFVPRKALGVH